MNDQRDRIVKKNSVKIIDRCFSHGDVVKKCEDYPKGQAGTIKDVKIKFDVQFVNSCKNLNHCSSLEHVVGGVPAQWVKPPHPFQKKHLCVYNNKFVTYVKTVYFDIELEFRQANHKVVIRDVDPEIFFSEDENERILDASYPFRLDQTIKFSRYHGTKVEMLKNGEWSGKSKYEQRVHRVSKVTKVSPTKVDLRKLFMKPNMPDTDEDHLDEFLLIPIDKIRPYQYFNYTRWGVGEFGFVSHSETKLRNILQFQNNISSTNYDPSKFEHSFEYIYNERYFTELRHNPKKYLDPDKFVRIISSQTFVDVLWQDGSVSINLPAIQLCPFSHIQAKDFFPGDTVRFVYQNNTDNNNNIEEENKIMKKELGTIVSVDHEEKVCDVLGFHRKEFVEVPSFELEECEEFHFDLGDAVVDLRVTMSSDNVLVDKRTRNVGWTGEIISLTPNFVKVFWQDTESMSEVKRDSLLNLNPMLQQIEEEEEEEEETGEEEEEEGEDKEQHSSSKSSSDSDSDNNFNEEEEEEEKKKGGEYQKKNDWVTKLKKEEEEEEEEKIIAQEEEDSEEVLEKFLMIPEFEFHKYQHKNFNSKSTSTTTSFLKRISRELLLFQKKRVLSTTMNIHIISTRTRMDLFRFVIFGAKNTPYYHSIFIFDVYCNPQTYPTKPPKVRFYSKGVEINPNLYEDGKICLSLLNTWRGKERGECWIPGVSNLFQVVQSIQTFILNDQPWFNEAGHDRFKNEKFDEQSRMFNEEAILNVVKQQTSQFRDINVGNMRIGKVLRSLLSEHVRKRRGELISMLNDYSLGEVKSGEMDVLNLKKSSRGFETVLKKLIPKLELEIEKFLDYTEEEKEEIVINNNDNKEEEVIEKKDEEVIDIEKEETE